MHLPSPTVVEGTVPLVHALSQGLATWMLAKAGPPALIAEPCAAWLSAEREWGLLTKATEPDCYTRPLPKNSNTHSKCSKLSLVFFWRPTATAVTSSTWPSHLPSGLVKQGHLYSRDLRRGQGARDQPALQPACFRGGPSALEYLPIFGD